MEKTSLLLETYKFVYHIIAELVSPEGVVVLAVLLGTAFLPVADKQQLLISALQLGGGAAYGYRQGKKGEKALPSASPSPVSSENLVPSFEANM
jgi:hypothetical protein